MTVYPFGRGIVASATYLEVLVADERRGLFSPDVDCLGADLSPEVKLCLLMSRGSTVRAA